MKPRLRRLVKAVWRELKGSSTIELPGGIYKLAWGARHSTRRLSDDYEVLVRLARDRSCIFDVGAKVGMTTMCMARATRGTVYAFEAAESSCFVLDRNVQLNGLERQVVTVNTLVGGASGGLCEYHWSPISGRSGIVLAPSRGAIPVQKPAVTLDDFARENALCPDLVKIDVEGAEQQVLVGMRRILRTHKPDVVLELHAWPGTSAAANVAPILSLLGALDYRMLWLETEQCIEDSTALAGIDEPSDSLEAQARFLLRPCDRTVQFH